MDKRKAYALASQWASYVNGADPGRCFYGFYYDDGRPMTEEHRADCIAYAKQCASRLETGIAMGTVSDDASEARADLADLQALVEWFETCEIADA